MIHDNQVLGGPLVIFADTKDDIEDSEVYGGSFPEGSIAYATDTDKIGWYDGSEWVFFNLEDVVLSSLVLEPTGFPNRTDSSLSFTDGTRTFEIVPTGSSFDYYIRGTKYTVSAADSVVIPDTTGLHFIYYDGATLTDSMTPWEFDDDVCFVATVFWHTGVGGVIGDERHGFMPWQVHEWMHNTIGARYNSGLGADFSDVTAISVDSGMIYDEDIKLEIAAQTDCRLFYRNVSLDFTFAAASASYVYTSGGILQYDDSGVITEVSVNDYMAYWIFATNDPDTPIWVLVGQREDNTLTDARNNNLYGNLSLGDLPFAEMKILYRVIVRRTAANPGGEYVETEDLRAVANLSSGTYVATDHNTLTNRGADGAHPASAIEVDTTSFGGVLSSADDDAQAALDTLDDHLHDDRYYTESETDAAIDADIATHAADADAHHDVFVAADIDTLAELNAIVTDATLDDSGDSRDPNAHADSHKNGGSDEIATATPTANAIPKADASGSLDAWVSGGGGGGDMTKAVYDTDDDGVVDDAEALGGVAAADYLTETEHTAIGDSSPHHAAASVVDTTSIDMSISGQQISAQREALTGDVTAPKNSNVTTIVNDAVTNAKLDNMAESTIKGRNAGAGLGNPQDLTAAQVASIVQTVLDAVYLKLTGGTMTGQLAVNGANILLGASSGRIGSSSEVIELRGNTSSALLSVQDGNGRIQLKWNASRGTGETYLVSGEPAFFIDMTIFDDPILEIKYAGNGTAGASISWNTLLALYDDGRVYLNGNMVWNAGNDGDGSGLDADKVDGKHPTATPAANALPLADSGGDLDAWISDASTSQKGKVQLASALDVINRVSNEVPTANLVVPLVYGDTYLGEDSDPDSFGIDLLGHAQGKFFSDGDAQYMRGVSRRALSSLTSGTWYTLDEGSEYYTESDTVLLVDTRVVGTDSGGNRSWSYKINATINGDGPSIVDQTVTTLYESDSAYEVQLVISSASLWVQVRRSGGTSYSTRWVAVTEIVMVEYS